VTDTRVRAMMLAVIGSLGLAILCVIVLDRIDSRFRYPEQVTHGLGLSILGAVPQARKRKGGPNPEETTQMVESFRELQLNVRTIFKGGPVVLAVTSPGPGDGKTFTTSNLALTFAEGGHRTLLIDGDVRRGTQNAVFSLPRKPGLTDYLAGRATREEVIHRTTYAGLDVLPCGTRMQDGRALRCAPPGL
jgi:Mrp family chromosome partitioning ATPase